MNNTDIKQIFSLTKNVIGWLTDKEAILLFNITSSLTGKGSVAEIGSYQGKSTIFIASALKIKKINTTFYAIDPHVGSEEHKVEGKNIWTYDMFMKNITGAGVATLITPIVKDSVSFSKECKDKFEFIFIDGAHDFDSVLQDIDAWFPKLIEGGYIAFHDTYVGGDPYKALAQKIYTSRHVSFVRTADSITYVQKVEKNSIVVFTTNIALMLFKNMLGFLYRFSFFKKYIFLIKNTAKNIRKEIFS